MHILISRAADDSTPSWQKGLFRPSSGAKAVGAGAPEAKGDALPFLRKAEKVIRDKIDHENQQAHNAPERLRSHWIAPDRPASPMSPQIAPERL